jgi:hypothetical protein
MLIIRLTYYVGMYFIRLHLVEVSLFSCVFINYVVKKHICYVCTLCIINYLK